MWDGVAISNEYNILKAELLGLFLLGSQHFGVFALSHGKKVGASCKFTHCFLRAVDFEERRRQRMQTDKAFCCVSIGLSFL
jgi:hypothetical protein